MKRNSLRLALIALLCILALGAAASTLDTAVDTTDPSDGTGGGGGIGGDMPDRDTSNATVPGDVMAGNATGSGGFQFQGLCLTFLRSPTFLLAAGVAAVAFGALLARRYGKVVPLGLGVALFGPTMLAFYILSACGSTTLELNLFEPNRTQPPNGSSGVGGPGSGGETSLVSTPSLVMLGLGLVLVVALLIYVSGGEEGEQAATSDEEVDEASLGAIGRAAGDAADRIESATDVENEVYRAWREMTAHLDVERPQTSTPGEFASAATEAGMHPSDVSELTDLFEEVRYGHAEATEDRETRAVEALRRIEEAYAGIDEPATLEEAESSDGATGLADDETGGSDDEEASDE